MSLLFEKSRLWRSIVVRSRDSKGFFLAFGVVCIAVPLAVGAAVMAATNPGGAKYDERQKALLTRGRQDAQVMGQVNLDRLGQLLQEIQKEEDTEDRYKAALRGETLTGEPGARIRGGGGSSVHYRQSNNTTLGAVPTSATQYPMAVVPPTRSPAVNMMSKAATPVNANQASAA